MPARPFSSAGDLRLDPARHQCWRGEVEIELTPRQFALLEFLMSRAGDVVSKTEILEHVWDEAFDRRSEHRRGVRRLPPQEARRPVRPGEHPDRPTGRLSTGSRSWIGAVVRRTVDDTARTVGRRLRRRRRASYLGAVLVLVVLRNVLVRHVDSAARDRADEVADLLRSDRCRRRSPCEWPTRTVVQVVRDDGAVVAASANVEGIARISQLRPRGRPHLDQDDARLPRGRRVRQPVPRRRARGERSAEPTGAGDGLRRRQPRTGERERGPPSAGSCSSASRSCSADRGHELVVGRRARCDRSTRSAPR